MRVIHTIPHPSFRITIMSMNDKYILRIEAGPMEQLYKINHTEVSGPEGIEKMLSEEFLKEATNSFNEMWKSWIKAKANF